MADRAELIIEIKDDGGAPPSSPSSPSSSSFPSSPSSSSSPSSIPPPLKAVPPVPTVTPGEDDADILGDVTQAVGGVRLATQAVGAPQGASAAGGAAAGGAAAGGATGGAAAGAVLAGPVGVVLAVAATLSAVTVVGDMLVDTIKDVDRALDDMVEELSNFNATIAAAKAERHIANIESKFTQAARLEDELSEFVSQRTEVDVLLRDIQTDLAEVLIPVATEIAGAIEGGLIVVKSISSAVNRLNTFMGGELGPVIAGAVDPNLGMIVRLLNWLADNSDQASTDALQSELADFLNPGMVEGFDSPDVDPPFLPPAPGIT